jgi:exonuclease III
MLCGTGRSITKSDIENVVYEAEMKLRKSLRGNRILHSISLKKLKECFEKNNFSIMPKVSSHCPKL